MWPLLMKLFLLVFSAYSAGILAQLFRQSAIVGYLLAGSIVGALLFDYTTVASVAELGVALLLFSIGLEFSFQQLKALGKSLLSGGSNGSPAEFATMTTLPFSSKARSNSLASDPNDMSNAAGNVVGSGVYVYVTVTTYAWLLVPSGRTCLLVT